MRDVQLPDGSWVTTAISVGVGEPKEQCEDDKCLWQDYGPSSGGERPVQMQRCGVCEWVRGRYLFNPHPEVTK
jgi:hypothetical protein